MNGKHNDPTINRPEGDRELDARSLAVDINDHLRRIKEENAWKKSDRNSITVFKSGDITLVVGGLHKDAELIPHKSGGMTIMQVLEGSLHITTNEFSKTFSGGSVVVVHKGDTYGVKALDESFYFLTVTSDRS